MMENPMGDNSLKKPAGVLLIVLFAILVVYVVALTRNEFKQYSFIGRTEQQTYTITIGGEGKITAIPDIAQISVGVHTESKQVETAQKENTQKMNALIAELKAQGIDAKDISTLNYSIYPMYDYFDGRQSLRGYTVDQSVMVKIRDLQKVGQIIEIAGRSGANQVSGLNFTIDEPETLRQQAREKALGNAKEKAESLARVAGVKIGKLVSFSEYGAPESPVFYKDYAVGMGGGAGVAPQVEPGSQDIIVNVTVTYEVL